MNMRIMDFVSLDTSMAQENHSPIILTVTQLLQKMNIRL